MKETKKPTTIPKKGKKKRSKINKAKYSNMCDGQTDRKTKRQTTIDRLLLMSFCACINESKCKFITLALPNMRAKMRTKSNVPNYIHLTARNIHK